MTRFPDYSRQPAGIGYPGPQRPEHDPVLIDGELINVLAGGTFNVAARSGANYICLAGDNAFTLNLTGGTGGMQVHVSVINFGAALNATLPGGEVIRVLNAQTIHRDYICDGWSLAWMPTDFPRGLEAVENKSTTASGGDTQLGTIRNGATIKQLFLLHATTRVMMPTDIFPGASFMLAVVQDGTGGRLATWDPLVKWPGGTVPTLTSTAGRLDLFSFVSMGGDSWLGSAGPANYVP